MEHTQVNQSVFMKDSEFNRFGLISVILIVVGCLGGVAVGVGAISSILSLSLVLIPTMATLSLLLAVAPMKYIYYAGVTSVIIDLIMITYYSLV